MEKNKEYRGLRKVIGKILNENSYIFEDSLDEEDLDEERIANHDAYWEIDQKKNFVGSHTYGEDLGKQVDREGEIYVVYSYGQPLYVWERV